MADNSPEQSDFDDHENCDHLLRERDMLEVNMSLEDKRELCKAVKMSESTHAAEKQEREDFHRHSQIIDENNGDLVKSAPNDEVNNATLEIPTPHLKTFKTLTFDESVKNLGDLGCSVYPITSNRSTSPDLVVLDVFNSSSIRDEVRPSISPRPSRLALKLKDGPKHKASEQVDGVPGNSNKPLPIAKEKFVDCLQETEFEDTVRNIDVWNCEKIPEKTPLVDCRPHRNHPKPFYVVPPGMNLEDYLVYFKSHLNSYAEKLVKSQRKSFDFVPWGSPVGVGNNFEKTNFQFDTNDFESETFPTSSQNERYNFRGRKPPLKRINDVLNIEDNSSDDELFTKKVRKDPVEKSVPNIISVQSADLAFSAMIGLNSPTVGSEMMGNENAAITDHVTDPAAAKGRGKSQRNNNSIRNMKTGVANPTTVSLEIDSDEDYEPGGKEMILPRSKLQRANGGARKKVSKPTKILEPSEVKSDLSEQASGGWMNAKAPQVIKPGPVGKHIRILRTPNSPINKTARPKREKKPKLDAEQIAFELVESENSKGGSQENVQCPMCSEHFSPSEITQHANNCCESSQNLHNTSLSREETFTDCPICHEEFEAGALFLHSKDCTSSQSQQKRRIVPQTRGFNKR